MFGGHDDLTVAPVPLRTWPIRVQFDAVNDKITKIKSLTHTMVGGAGNRILTLHQPVISMRKVLPARVTNGEMIQSSCAGRTRWGVQILGEHKQPRPRSS